MPRLSWLECVEAGHNRKSGKVDIPDARPPIARDEGSARRRPYRVRWRCLYPAKEARRRSVGNVKDMDVIGGRCHVEPVTIQIEGVDGRRG